LGICLSPKFAVDLKLATGNGFPAVQSRYLSRYWPASQLLLLAGVDRPSPPTRTELSDLEFDAVILHGGASTLYAKHTDVGRPAMAANLS
jgi:hypothetical protein